MGKHLRIACRLAIACESIKPGHPEPNHRLSGPLPVGPLFPIVPRLETDHSMGNRRLDGHDLAFSEAGFQDLPPDVRAILGVDEVIGELIPHEPVVTGWEALARAGQSPHHDGHREAARASRPQHPATLPEGQDGVGDVLEGVGVDDEIIRPAGDTRHVHHVELRIGAHFMTRTSTEEPTQVPRLIDFEDPQQSAPDSASEVPETAPGILCPEDCQRQCLRPEIGTAIGAPLSLLSIDIRVLLVREAPLVTERSPQGRVEVGAAERSAAWAGSEGSRR